MAVASNTKKGTPGGKLVSVAAWCVAVWTTQEFIAALIEAPPEQATAVVLWAALIQAVMTWGESPIWNGRGQWWHYSVLLLDVITNIGGLFFFVMKLDRTDSWAAFNTGLGTSGGMNPFAALLVSAVLGVMVAAAPEFLWRKG